jgi:hypothetical protein
MAGKERRPRGCLTSVIHRKGAKDAKLLKRCDFKRQTENNRFSSKTNAIYRLRRSIIFSCAIARAYLFVITGKTSRIDLLCALCAFAVNINNK